MHSIGNFGGKAEPIHSTHRDLIDDVCEKESSEFVQSIDSDELEESKGIK